MNTVYWTKVCFVILWPQTESRCCWSELYHKMQMTKHALNKEIWEFIPFLPLPKHFQQFWNPVGLFSCLDFSLPESHFVSTMHEPLWFSVFRFMLYHYESVFTVEIWLSNISNILNKIKAAPSEKSHNSIFNIQHWIWCRTFVRYSRLSMMHSEMAIRWLVVTGHHVTEHRGCSLVALSPPWGCRVLAGGLSLHTHCHFLKSLPYSSSRSIAPPLAVGTLVQRVSFRKEGSVSPTWADRVSLITLDPSATLPADMKQMSSWPRPLWEQDAQIHTLQGLNVSRGPLLLRRCDVILQTLWAPDIVFVWINCCILKSQYQYCCRCCLKL